MTRTAAREIAVKLCYANSENPRDASEWLSEFFDKEYYASLLPEDGVFDVYPDKKQRAYIESVVLGVNERKPELDGYIERFSTGWKFDRISKTAAAIMRVTMYEVLYMPDVPDKAAINEAVELAKKYESPETVPFINGILGSFSRSEVSGV